MWEVCVHIYLLGISNKECNDLDIIQHFDRNRTIVIYNISSSLVCNHIYEYMFNYAVPILPDKNCHVVHLETKEYLIFCYLCIYIICENRRRIGWNALNANRVKDVRSKTFYPKQDAIHTITES